VNAEAPLVRPATAQDSRALWQIRNQEDVRRVSNNAELIPWEKHEVWFARYRKNPENHAFVLEEDGAVVGYCRIDAGLVSIALDASVRGRGYGTVLLTEAVRQYHAEGPVRAFIRCGNETSLKLFKKAGFSPDREDAEGYHLTFHGPVRA
jgi:ribosomal protein S18 acetylase RimI-like enzyme